MSEDLINYRMSPFPGDWAQAVCCAQLGQHGSWEGGDLVFNDGKEVNRAAYKLDVTSPGRIAVTITSSKVRLRIPYLGYIQEHGGAILELRKAIKTTTLAIQIRQAAQS